jgi:hypothetical protein
VGSASTSSFPLALVSQAFTDFAAGTVGELAVQVDG